MPFAVRAPASAEVPGGAAYVTTLPSGADVWLDGTYVGRSPVLVDGLARGHHALTLTKSGWKAEEVDVVVAPGTVAMASERLDPGPHGFAKGEGALEVRAVPAGATLALDGLPFDADAGKTVSLGSGIHKLSATTQHGRTTQAFSVYPGTTTNIVLREPTPAEGPAGVVAPAEDYLPDGSYALDGTRLTVKYAGHVVTGKVGEATLRVDGVSQAFASAAQTIGGKLYLPLELLEKLTADPSNK